MAGGTMVDWTTANLALSWGFPLSAWRVSDHDRSINEHDRSTGDVYPMMEQA